MLGFESILCPVDFSEPSERALRYAVALAAQEHSQLTILSVNDPLLVSAAAAAYEPGYLTRETEQELRELFQRLLPENADWAPVPGLVAAEGDPIARILEYSRTADLVVMGTHGLGGYRKMICGSTTERLLRRTRIPVLGVPPVGRESAELSRGRAVLHVKMVIAAVDLDEGAESIARRAAALARHFGATLLLVHVVRELRAPARWRMHVEASERAQLETAQRAMDALAAKIDSGSGVRVRVTIGRPAEEIAAAAEHDSALIVMGVTGPNDKSGARPGSIAHRVFSLAPAPILVVPPQATPASSVLDS